MQKSKSTEFAQILMDLPIDVEDVNLSSAVGPILDISRQFGLSSYDAQYLELAARKTLDLAVNDRGLRRAAQQAKVALMRNPLSTGIDGQ